MDSFDFVKYLDIAKRRFYWMVIPFLVTLLGGLTYALVAPRLYQAETLILVQPQSVPESFVQSIVSEGVDERLKTITQQVTSRTNLENIIEEHRLAEDSALRGLVAEEKVALVRAAISIGVNPGDKRKTIRGRESGTSTFTIQFTWEDPRKAMRVANALSSNFISENLKVRETQALGTSSFLSEELATIEKRLEEKEEELKIYREKYMGGLPTQLDANLRVIEGLRSQLDRLNTSVREREGRRALLQGDLEGGQATAVISPIDPQRRGGGETRDLASLKSELAALEAKYTSSHPDIIRLKSLIESLEKKEADRIPDTGGSAVPVTAANRRTMEELRNVEGEIKSLRAESERISNQIRTYQKWVDETPRREQELFALNRDYERLKESHSSLLKRKLEAEIAVSMEKKAKGEQFRVIDSAKLPTRPVKPDLKRTLLTVLALGVGLGLSLAYLVEMTDTSFRDPEDLEEALKVPILISIPIRRTDQEIKTLKRMRILKATGVGVGFIFSVMGIFVAAKGVDGTLQYISGLTEQLLGP